MKQLITLIIASLLLCGGLAACGGDRDIERQLDRADAMMDSIPAEALTIIQEIDRSRLGDADAARHALLLSQAYDKTAVDIADDSLIAIARDYYLTHPGRRDMLARAYYYSGVVAFNAADYPESIYYLSLADTLAAGVADHRLRGMANAMLAWSNSELLDLENEYRHAERALRFFTLAGDSARISRQKLYVAICHLQLNRPAEALAMLDSPGCEQSAVTRASSLVELGRLDEFRAMMELNPALSNSSKLMSRYAGQLVGIGNLVEADSALARALRNAKNISDTASCMGVKAELLKSRGDIYGYSEIKDHKLVRAYEILHSFKAVSRNVGYTESFNTIGTMEKADAERRHHNIITVIVIVVILVLAALTAFIAFLRLKHRHDEIQYNLSLASALLKSEQLTKYTRSLYEAYIRLEEAVSRRPALPEMSQATVDRILGQLNHKANEYFLTSSLDKDKRTELRQEISSILNDNVKRTLEFNVDKLTNGLVTRLRAEKIKEIDVEVYVLDYLGMDNSMIMLLTGSSSEASVASRKTRIYKKVKKLTSEP